MAYEQNEAQARAAFEGNANLAQDEVSALLAQLTLAGVFEDSGLPGGGQAVFSDPIAGGVVADGAQVITVDASTANLASIETNLAARIILANDVSQDINLTLNGSNNKSVLLGSGNNLVQDTGGGSDAIFGGVGSDTIGGGAGSDFLSGGDGNDVIGGGTGDDTIGGGTGNDLLFGEAGDDLIGGGAGNDTLNGGCLLYTSPSPRD